MPALLEVQARTPYRLWLRYADGTEGVIDLGDLVARGVFRALHEPRAFERVHVGAQGQVAWTPDLELCADALWLRLTGKRPEDLFPVLQKARRGA